MRRDHRKQLSRLRCVSAAGPGLGNAGDCVHDVNCKAAATTQSTDEGRLGRQRLVYDFMTELFKAAVAAAGVAD